MSECDVTGIEAANTVVCVASNSFWWVAPLILGLSALTAAVISIVSIKANKKIARQRATLDLIERSESTEYYQATYQAFTQVRKDAAGFDQLINATNPQVTEQRQKVISYLNHYELLAIGIYQGVLDKGLYKRFMRSTVVRDWHEAEPFINHLRRPTPDSGSEVSASKAYSNFERLAKEWAPEVQLNLPIEPYPGDAG